jgi:hypothetical protein
MAAQGEAIKTESIEKIETFRFGDIHPNVFMGTASDRYAGWIGQIYSENRYLGKISSRTKSIGKNTFTEHVLPVESVVEFFDHFAVLEIDFTFYSLLLDKDLNPTPNYHVLRTYAQYLEKENRLILKVPQVVFARKIWKDSSFGDNPYYLKEELFTRHFYEPANELVGQFLKGFIFEQEYQVRKHRVSPDEHVAALEGFLKRIPRDDRYHMEIRTEPYLTPAYFCLLREYGVGQVLSHWTWLSPLRRQFAKGDQKFLNAGRQCIIRLLTPLKVKYEQAYERAFPFDKMVDGMMDPHMVEDTVWLIYEGTRQGIHMNVIINNRAGGNAPMMAQEISRVFLEKDRATK